MFNVVQRMYISQGTWWSALPSLSLVTQLPFLFGQISTKHIPRILTSATRSTEAFLRLPQSYAPFSYFNLRLMAGRDNRGITVVVGVTQVAFTTRWQCHVAAASSPMVPEQVRPCLGFRLHILLIPVCSLNWIPAFLSGLSHLFLPDSSFYRIEHVAFSRVPSRPLGRAGCEDLPPPSSSVLLRRS